MRTDSHRVAHEAQDWARELISKTYGKDYVPEKPPVYKSKASAQEAHEAIRPTYSDKRPQDDKTISLERSICALYINMESFSFEPDVPLPSWNRQPLPSITRRLTSLPVI